VFQLRARSPVWHVSLAACHQGFGKPLRVLFWRKLTARIAICAPQAAGIHPLVTTASWFGAMCFYHPPEQIADDREFLACLALAATAVFCHSAM
jgi:hypothetical protein